MENDFSNATNLANYLVAKGIAFRVAHEVTGKIVAHCLANQCLLRSLDLSDYQQFHPDFDESVFKAIDTLTVIESHNARGGTAKARVNQLDYLVYQW